MPDQPSRPAQQAAQAATRLADFLAHPRPLRRGSLGERRMKCGKPNCPCAHDPDARHGPYFSLTRAHQGRTESRYLSPGAADLVRRQLDAHRELRARVREYEAAGEAWAEEELNAETADAQAEAEKGGSARRSRRNSKPRSAS